MTFTSDEVNFLVYRYLEESGFHHSAYLFGNESNLFNAGIDATMVPKGALLSIIQKGIFYTEAELFSIYPDVDLDSKLEKSVGSMTLIESIMPDGVRQKASEMKSPLCTPRQGTSANMASDRPLSRTPMSVPSTSEGPNALHEKQIKRERDMRGQQTVVNNLIVSSANSNNPGSNIPRGSYRTDLKSSTPAPSIATTSTAYGSSLPAATVPTPSSGFVTLGHGVPSSITSQLTNHLSGAMIGVASSVSNGILPSSTSSSAGGLIPMERERESREATARFLPNGHHLLGTTPGRTGIKLGGGTVGGGTIGSGGGGGSQTSNNAGSLYGSVNFGNNATRSF